MKVNFDAEFEKASEGAFPMLKFHSATYIKAARKLTVRFMIAAENTKSFDEARKKKVADTVSSMFKAIETDVQYIRTYADEETVRARVYAYFNEKNRMAFQSFTENSVAVTVEDGLIKVDIYVDTPAAEYLKSAGAERELIEWLYYSFNPPAAVAVHATGMPTADGETRIETSVFSGFSVRLVDIEVKEKIYERGNVGGIHQKPGYIADVTAPADTVVICGKVSGLSVREYRNKKFDPSAPKKQPEFLQMVRFSLDDTTGLMECVCFPTPLKVAALEQLSNGDTVVCLGKAGLSAHTGAISVAVNAVFRCEIDYDSLKTVNTRPVPAKYRRVFPQKYVAPEIMPDSLMEYAEGGKEGKGERPVPRGMLGKTFVVFDFEATDKNMSAEPIELSALKIVDGVPTETFSSLLDPGVPIPPFIQKLTGIKDEMVAGMPSIVEVLPDFYKFTRGAALVGHNIDGYDFPLLRKYSDKEGYLFDNETCDTLLLARRYFAELHRFSLEELTSHFGIHHTDAHRAYADVYATAEILKLLYERMEAGA